MRIMNVTMMMMMMMMAMPNPYHGPINDITFVLFEIKLWTTSHFFSIINTRPIQFDKYHLLHTNTNKLVTCLY